MTRASMVPPPAITNLEADRRFVRLAESLGHRVADKFVGGYVDYEWGKSRHLFEALPGGVDGKQALEFGCHIGASAIVLAQLGAHVTALDVAAHDLELARVNAQRYGLEDKIAFEHVIDTRTLPFPSARFELITCNSVLEYVRPEELGEVLREIDRVMAPGGTLMVLGTSNRLWPRDVHTKRWLLNYLPETWRAGRVRSVSPWRIKRGLPDYIDMGVLEGATSFLEAKAKSGWGPAKVYAASRAQAALRHCNVSLGMLAHSFTLLMRKPSA